MGGAFRHHSYPTVAWGALDELKVSKTKHNSWPDPQKHILWQNTSNASEPPLTCACSDSYKLNGYDDVQTGWR